MKLLIDPLKYIECGAYGDLFSIYPKPSSTYLKGNRVVGWDGWDPYGSFCMTSGNWGLLGGSGGLSK